MIVDPSDIFAIYKMFRRQIDSISKDSKYTFAEPRRQNFSLPPDVISHIFNKPISPKGLQKLFQTCKYFFNKKQILIFYYDAYVNETQLSSMNTRDNKVFNWNKKVLFWFTSQLKLCLFKGSVLNMVYRSSLTKLLICSSNLSFVEFEMLASNDSKIRDFTLSHSSIYYLDGTNVSIDAILQMLPKIEKIGFDNDQETFTKQTLKNLLEIRFLNKIRYFNLNMRSVSPSFDPSLLCQFLKENLAPILHPHPHATIFIFCENRHVIKENIDASIKGILDMEGKIVNIKTFARR